MRFTLDDLPGHRRVSLRAIPFSQLQPRHFEPLAPHCDDRRWNGRLYHQIAQDDDLPPRCFPWESMP